MRTPEGEAAVNVTLVCGKDAREAYFCLFPKATDAKESAIGEIPRVENLPTGERVFAGVFPRVKLGDFYGFRVDAPWDPREGKLGNPYKLIFHPLAAAASHTFHVPPLTGPKADPRPYAFDLADRSRERRSEVDSGSWAPKGVVVDLETDGQGDSPLAAGVRGLERPPVGRRPVPRSVLEVNPRTLTADLGRQLAAANIRPRTFAAMGTPAAMALLETLGFADLELMPPLISADERHLADDRSNWWGYNGFGIALDPRLVNDARGAQYGPAEFRRLLRVLHERGMGVYMDVAPGHTAEGDGSGIALTHKLLGNREAYRLYPRDLSRYVDFSGCLNAVDTSTGYGLYYVSEALKLLAQWYPLRGFRFDQGPLWFRDKNGDFNPNHPLFELLSSDPVLSRMGLIFEPHDVPVPDRPRGDDDHTGAFIRRLDGALEWSGWWNNRVRGFFRGDPDAAGAVADALSGFAAVYSSPRAFAQLSTHDGWPAAATFAFGKPWNAADQAGGGPPVAALLPSPQGQPGRTDDPGVARTRQTLLMSQLMMAMLSLGPPLVGQFDAVDAFPLQTANGYTDQNGPELRKTPRAEAHRAQVGFLNQWRERHLPLFQPGKFHTEQDVTWWHPAGRKMGDGADWNAARTFGRLLHGKAPRESGASHDVTDGAPQLSLVSQPGTEVNFVLPAPPPPAAPGGRWGFVADASRSRWPLQDRMEEVPNRGLQLPRLTADLWYDETQGGISTYSPGETYPLEGGSSALFVWLPAPPQQGGRSRTK